MEKFRPIPPEGEHKPKSPHEAGAGPLGKPPPPDPERDLRGQGEEWPPAQRGHESTPVQHAQELEILTLFQEAKVLLGNLPHPLAQEFKDAMTKRTVREVWGELYPELKRQADKLDEEVLEALQDPVLRKRILGRD